MRVYSGILVGPLAEEDFAACRDLCATGLIKPVAHIVRLAANVESSRLAPPRRAFELSPARLNAGRYLQDVPKVYGPNDCELSTARLVSAERDGYGTDLGTTRSDYVDRLKARA